MSEPKDTYRISIVVSRLLAGRARWEVISREPLTMLDDHRLVRRYVNSLQEVDHDPAFYNAAELEAGEEEGC